MRFTIRGCISQPRCGAIPMSDISVERAEVISSVPAKPLPDASPHLSVFATCETKSGSSVA